ncbi:MAG: pyridoxal phosphate-dependent aminotransferase [Vulcanimicrobiaceae bacterium]
MNPAVAGIAGSTIRALHALRTPTSLDLGLGQPTLAPNVAHFETATRWVAAHGIPYSSNIGDAELRAAIAAHYAYPGLDDPGNVCITTGSQEAVYAAMRTVLDPAVDDVLVVEPAFPVYLKIAQLEGVASRRLALDPQAEEPFDADAILAAVGPRTRLIVICSPCNPTGNVISRAATRKIADGLLARGGAPVYVMHDEIYREIAYTDDVGDFGSVYPYTISVNSLSKSNALTGLRLGWLVAPNDVMPQIVKLHGWLTSCASTFAQRVALEIFAANELGAHRSWYASQRERVLDALAATPLDFVVPQGAFYCCVRVGAPDTLAFARALVAERDVIAVPGDVFGPSLAGWLRTSFVAPLPEIREGLARIADFAERYVALASSVGTSHGMDADRARAVRGPRDSNGY